MRIARRLSFVWPYRLQSLFLAFLFAGWDLTAAPATVANLGPGVNLGNALEAPRGANWGIQLEPGYFSGNVLFADGTVSVMDDSALGKLPAVEDGAGSVMHFLKPGR